MVLIPGFLPSLWRQRMRNWHLRGVYLRRSLFGSLFESLPTACALCSLPPLTRVAEDRSLTLSPSPSYSGPHSPQFGPAPRRRVTACQVAGRVFGSLPP